VEDSFQNPVPFVLRVGKHALPIFSTGFSAPLYLAGAILVGPFPTVFQFFALPFLRFHYFVVEVWRDLAVGWGWTAETSQDCAKAALMARSGVTPAGQTGTGSASAAAGSAAAKAGAEAGKDAKDGADGQKKNSPRSTAHLVAAADPNMQRAQLRKRRQNKNKEQKELDDRVEEILDGKSEDEADAAEKKEADAAQKAKDTGKDKSGKDKDTGKPLSDAETGDEAEKQRDLSAVPKRTSLSLQQKLTQTSVTPNRARMEIAAVTQFDLLLPLTKPIIPLAMLVLTGQVWYGVISSLCISSILRNWVPRLNYETHHLICFIFGFVHTILGVSAHQVLIFDRSVWSAKLIFEWFLLQVLIFEWFLLQNLVHTTCRSVFRLVQRTFKKRNERRLSSTQSRLPVGSRPAFAFDGNGDSKTWSVSST